MRLERGETILIDVISPEIHARCDACGLIKDNEVVKISVSNWSGSTKNSIRLCKRCVRVLRELL